MATWHTGNTADTADTEAQYIVQALAARGLSDNSIARAIGRHRVSVLRIRQGLTSGSRSLERLRALAYANGLSDYTPDASDPEERGAYATPRGYLDRTARPLRAPARAQLLEDPEPTPRAPAPRPGRQSGQRGRARGSDDATLLTQLTALLAPISARVQQAQPAPQRQPAPQPSQPSQRLPGLALIPALQATRAPLIVCTVCGRTASASEGYSAQYGGATVYLCSRACAQRLR